MRVTFWMNASGSQKTDLNSVLPSPSAGSRTTSSKQFLRGTLILPDRDWDDWKKKKKKRGKKKTHRRQRKELGVMERWHFQLYFTDGTNTSAVPFVGHKGRLGR